MDYAEASYFEGFHFQHIAAWLEQRRLQHQAQRARQGCLSGILS